jgi:hypothetical protein
VSLDADLVKLELIGTSIRTVCGSHLVRSPSRSRQCAASHQQLCGLAQVMPSAEGCKSGVYFEGVVALMSSAGQLLRCDGQRPAFRTCWRCGA